MLLFPVCAKPALDRLLLPALKVPRGLPLSLVSATLRSNPISVDSKPLTGMLSPLDATLTKNTGGREHPAPTPNPNLPLEVSQPLLPFTSCFHRLPFPWRCILVEAHADRTALRKAKARRPQGDWLALSVAGARQRL